MPVAILTGASRGLGLALARALSERGWRVVVDARDGSALADAVAGLAGVGAIPGDVTDAEHRRALVDAAGERIDLLVNNASRLGPSPQPALADYPLAELARVYEANLFAPLGLVQLALPRLAPGAAIVNITSDAGAEAYEGWGGYGSSKAALDQLTAILAAQPPGRRPWPARVATDEDYPRRHGRPIRYGYVPKAWPLEAYQTVFAREPGSAEMPSAGRPFTAELVTKLVTAGGGGGPPGPHTRASPPGRGAAPD